jgi:hypothetical protein
MDDIWAAMEEASGFKLDQSQRSANSGRRDKIRGE